MAYSNQRITKIKRDVILELLQRAEAMDVEDACVVVPAEQSLAPYPDADQTRTWIRDYLLKGINGIIPIDAFYWGSSSDNWAITRPAQTYISTVLIDGLPLYVYNHKIIDNPNVDAEFDYQLVTKPGLMLSNLLCPVSFDAGQGSYIRQANSTNAEIYGQGTNESYNCRDFRSLYHGHYGYTFLNRGIIHRESGSTHDNNDSYMLHYSPLPNSSTSYEGMLIPGTLFQNSYTNIQTICYPTNPSMQGWSDTTEKTLSFTAINNNTDNSNNTTTYNGRFVGEGWSYEISASGNHSGSGSNWGENPTTGPNSSNGICVNGEIVYTDINGLECTQLIVDWCTNTIQSVFNPNNPNAATDYNNNLIGGQSSTLTVRGFNGDFEIGLYRTGGGIPKTDYNRYQEILQSGMYCIAGAYRSNSAFQRVPGTRPNGDTIDSPGIRRYNPTSPNTFDYYSTYPDYQECIFSWRGTNDGNYGGYYAHSNAKATFYFSSSPTGEVEGESNVNIYLNITDNAKLYAEQGLMWNYACNERTRFTYEVSTTPCTETYCTSKLLYENLTITADGDFSTDIPDITITG